MTPKARGCTATTGWSSPPARPPANQRYLVQLTITSLASEAVAQSNDIEAIIRGFVVAAK